MRPSGPEEPRVASASHSPVGDGPGAPPAPVMLSPREILPPERPLRSPPSALSAMPNALGLLVALRRRWFLAVSLGLVVGAAAAVAMWYVRPVSYAARTLLHVSAVQPRILFQPADGPTDFSSYQRSQAFLVKSRYVLNTALRDPKVAELPSVKKQVDPLDWLDKRILADFSQGPEIFRVSMAGDNPDELVLLLNAVRKAYLEEIVGKENKQRMKRLDQLKNLNAEYDTFLRGKKDILKAMEADLGAQDKGVLAKKQEFQLKMLDQIEGELLKKQSELWKAQLDLLLLEGKERRASNTLTGIPINNPWLAACQILLEKDVTPITIPEKAVEDLLNKDRAIQGFAQTIADKEQEIARLKERSPAPEKEGQYTRAVAALEGARKALDERRAKLRPLTVEDLKSRYREDLRDKRLQAQDRVHFLRDWEAMLADKLTRHSQLADAVKKKVIDLGWLQNEIAQVEAVSKEASKQMQALQVEMQAPPRVTELEEAVATLATSETGRIRLAGGAGLGGLACMVFGIAFLEFRVRRVSGVDEVVHGLKLKLVGALPTVPKRAFSDSGAKRDVYWQNRLTESIDAIRTTLLNAARYEGLRTVMVTSAVGGEGKTLLSCHLAASLARAGRKTLLIDGDLRRPSVHRLFGLELGPGLGDLLLEPSDPAAVLNAGPVDGLTVMTAGHSGALAVQALAQPPLSELLAAFRETYDFVIIDSAPVLPVADSQLIGQHADGVVLSVMRDVSRLPEVYAAHERLALLRVRILGAVVNGASGNTYGSSYYHHAASGADAGHAEA